MLIYTRPIKPQLRKHCIITSAVPHKSYWFCSVKREFISMPIRQFLNTFRMPQTFRRIIIFFKSHYSIQNKSLSNGNFSQELVPGPPEGVTTTDAHHPSRADRFSVPGEGGWHLCSFASVRNRDACGSVRTAGLRSGCATRQFSGWY